MQIVLRVNSEYALEMPPPKNTPLPNTPPPTGHCCRFWFKNWILQILHNQESIDRAAKNDFLGLCLVLFFWFVKE